MKPIQMYDLVALTEDLQVEKFMTDEQIILPRGQVGTVVEEYNNGEAFEIEFSHEDGQAYALVALKPTQLMPIYLKAPQLVLSH
jgi:D-alanyl-D-alanine dipeptidase